MSPGISRLAATSFALEEAQPAVHQRACPAEPAQLGWKADSRDGLAIGMMLLKTPVDDLRSLRARLLQQSRDRSGAQMIVVVEVQQPLPRGTACRLVASHRASRQPVPARVGVGCDPLAETGVAHTRVADRGDRLGELRRSPIAHNEHLQTSVRLRKQRGQRPLQQSRAPDRRHRHRYERVGTRIGLVVGVIRSQAVQPPPVVRLLVEDRAQRGLQTLLEQRMDRRRTLDSPRHLGCQALQRGRRLAEPIGDQSQPPIEIVDAPVQAVETRRDRTEAPIERVFQAAHHLRYSRAGIP